MDSPFWAIFLFIVFVHIIHESSKKRALCVMMCFHQTRHFSIKPLKISESVYMTIQEKQKYMDEFNKNAVKQANKYNNMAETAHELGVKKDILYNWIYKYSSAPKLEKSDKSVRIDEHSHDELKLLIKEVARLTEERNLLKKRWHTLKNGHVIGKPH